jgi:hypothetical protein
MYEAQDVLQVTDDVHLICLEPRRGFRFKGKWQRELLYRDPTNRLMSMNPGLHHAWLSRVGFDRCRKFRGALPW